MTIHPEDIAFAKAKRGAGISWQHIGQMTGAHWPTLQSLCEAQRRAIPVARTDQPAKPETPSQRRDKQNRAWELDVYSKLTALSDGERRFSPALGGSQAKNAIERLRHRLGADTISSTHAAGYCLTERGRHVLAAYFEDLAQ